MMSSSMAAYVAFGNPRGKFHPQSASTRFPLLGAAYARAAHCITVSDANLSGFLVDSRGDFKRQCDAPN